MLRSILRPVSASRLYFVVGSRLMSTASNLLTASLQKKPAHGASGQLVNLLRTGDQALALKHEAVQYPELTLSRRQLCDIEMILNGAFSPLNGFMNQKEYESVVHNMRLADGTLFPLPITLDVSEKKAMELKHGNVSSICLRDEEHNLIAVLDIEDIYQPDKQLEAKLVFGGDAEHPAIEYLHNQAGSYYIGGKIRGLQLPPHYDYNDIRHSPAEVREILESKQWDKVVAFQTRNPLHRAHFEVTRAAMNQLDAKLLLHPVIGMTKPGDIDHHTRVKCYRRVMPNYPENSAYLSAIPLAMRMAGPREAVWHAIIRKNYGATHFIIGRDHAGPGSNSKGVDFYGPYEARDFALPYEKELGIKLCLFDMMVYVGEHKTYYPANAVPKGMKVDKLSGTEVRRRLATGEDIPEWFSFPEIVKILRHAHPPKHKQGFCVFFTGLSGSGKSTIANALLDRLMELDDRRLTVLDGDHVRQMLSSELNFSKEHRNLNIQRIGYVASEVVKHGGAAICAPIAPYATGRLQAKNLVSKYGGFLEIHVSTSVDVCEQRDRKGLYAKFRKGLMKGMTGLDDPYEVPENPTLSIDSSKVPVAEAVDTIVKKLFDMGYLVPKSE